MTDVFQHATESLPATIDLMIIDDQNACVM